MANESSCEMTEMSRFLSIAIFPLLLATFVYAEESILDGIKITQEPASIYPGESVNVSFYVSNPSEFTHWIYIPIKNIPEGLRVSSTLGFLSLKPNQSGNVTFVFTSSAGIPLKNRWFSYDLVDEAYEPEKLWILKTDKLLDNQRAIQFYSPVDVSYDIYPRYIYTGQEEPIKITFRLKNPNPRDHSVVIELYSKGVINYTSFPINLSPGTEQSITLSMPVPAQPGAYALAYKIIENVYSEESELVSQTERGRRLTQEVQAGKSEFVSQTERAAETTLVVRRFSPTVQKTVDFVTENSLQIMAAAVLVLIFIFRRKIADRVEKTAIEIKCAATREGVAADLPLLLGALAKRYARQILLLLGVADGLFIQLRFEFFSANVLLFALLHLELVILYFAGRRWELVRRAADKTILKFVYKAVAKAREHAALVYLFAGIALGFSALPIFRFLLEQSIIIAALIVAIVVLFALVSKAKENTSALREIYRRKHEPIIWAPMLVGIAGAYFALQKYGSYGSVGVLLVYNTALVLALFTLVMIERRNTPQ